jgi:hypothetical protein
MHRRKPPDRIGQLVERVVGRYGQPPDDNNGPSEWMPEAVVVDLAICTVLIIFALADWEGNAYVLLGLLALRWRRRRSA